MRRRLGFGILLLALAMGAVWLFRAREDAPADRGLGDRERVADSGKRGGWLPWRERAGLDSLPAASETATPEESARTGTRASGVVLDPTGAPVPLADVFEIRADFVQRRTVTDVVGKFVLHDLQPGERKIGASDSSGRLGALALSLVEGANDGVVIRLTEGTSIAGRVTLDGAPVAGASVELGTCIASDPADADVLRAREDVWAQRDPRFYRDGKGFVRETGTDADGRFVFTGLERASCRIEAWHPDAGRAAGRRLPETERTVSLALERGGEVDARVVGLDGKVLPVGGLASAIRLVQGKPDGMGARGEIVDGRFQLKTVPAGRYRLITVLQGRAGPAPSLVQVHAGRTTLLDVVVPWSSTIKGRVVDADGKPIAGAMLTVSTLRTKDEGEISWFVPLGATEENGLFEATHLSDAMTIEILKHGYAKRTIPLTVRDRATMDLGDVVMAAEPVAP